jgi:hypothetical protein
MRVMLILGAVLGLLAVSSNSAPPADSVKNLFPTYERLSQALNQDDLIGAQKIAQQLEIEGKAADNKTLAAHATDLQLSDSLFEARLEFKAISMVFIELIKGKSGYHIFRCEMPTPGCLMKNYDWVQSDTTIANPYLGQVMPGCGVMKE